MFVDEGTCLVPTTVLDHGVAADDDAKQLLSHSDRLVVVRDDFVDFVASRDRPKPERFLSPESEYGTRCPAIDSFFFLSVSRERSFSLPQESLDGVISPLSEQRLLSSFAVETRQIGIDDAFEG